MPKDSADNSRRNFQEDENVRQLLKKVKIKEIMKAVVTIFEDAELSEAEEKFMAHKIHYLTVLSRENKLVGFLSQKYLYKTISPRKFIDSGTKSDSDIITNPDILIDEDSYYSKDSLDKYILRNIINKTPRTISAEESVAKALLAMDRGDTGCVLALDKNQKVCGMVTYREIVDFFVDILIGKNKK